MSVKPIVLQRLIKTIHRGDFTYFQKHTYIKTVKTITKIDTEHPMFEMYCKAFRCVLYKDKRNIYHSPLQIKKTLALDMAV